MKPPRPFKVKPSPWLPSGGLVRAPFINPKGDQAGLFILCKSPRSFTVTAFAFPRSVIEGPRMDLGHFLENHSHAIIAEDVPTLAKAKAKGNAWGRSYQRGLVLTPCACEEMKPARTQAKARRGRAA